MRGCATMSRKRIFSSSFGIARWVWSRPVNPSSDAQALTATSPLVSGARRQDHLAGVDGAVDAGQALAGALLDHDAVELLEQIDLMVGVPAHALAAVAELVHQRAERGEALVEVRIVALDHGDRRHGLAGDRIDLALLPVLDVEGLGDLAGRVVHDRGEDDVLLDAEHFRRDLREGFGDALVDVPVAARLPDRIDRRRQRVDERMHVGGVEVVLLVPGGGRQHDVRIHAGRGHAEVERDQQVELAFRRLVVPVDFHRLLLAVLAEVLAHHAVLGAEQVFQEIFVPLARRAQADWSARRTGCAASSSDCPGPRRTACRSPDFSALRDIVLRLQAGRRRLFGTLQADWFAVAAPKAASPSARRGRCSRSARHPTGRPAPSATGFR